MSVDGKKTYSDEKVRTLVPLYKNNCNIENCTDYRGIKLMIHTTKLCKSHETNASRKHARKIQWELHTISRRLVERLREKKELRMVFIDLEIAHDIRLGKII